MAMAGMKRRNRGRDDDQIDQPRNWGCFSAFAWVAFILSAVMLVDVIAVAGRSLW